MKNTKTGVIRLENGGFIPCDATKNEDSTFDAPLVATIGETMYYLQPHWDFDFICFKPVPTLVDKSSIHKVVIYKIHHATGCSLCLDAMDEYGTDFGGVQELFFTSYEEALTAVNSIQQFNKTHLPDADWFEDYKKCVPFNYRYMLKFPLKPQDIILENNHHYVANRIIAYIYEGGAKIEYQRHDDESYQDGKEIHSQHIYSGIKNQYEIVPLLKKKPVIIDV